MKRMKGLVVVCSLMVIFPTIIQAETGEFLSFFKPYITFQEVYDTNIDLAPNPLKRGDFITTITPGIKFSTQPKSPVTGEFLQAPTAERRYGIDLDFNAGFNFYAKYHEDNYISLNGSLNAWYALTQNLNFRVRDYLIRSDDIREQDYSSTAIPGQYLPSRTLGRDPWIRNVFEPSLEYKFGRENTISLGYQNNVYNSQSNLSDDSVENTVYSKINYWFDIRNGMSFEYVLNLGNFQQSPDLVNNNATGRYIYRFNPRTSVFVNYIQSWFNYQRPGIDFIVYNPSLGIDHAFSSTLRGSLQLGYYWADPKRGSTVDGPSYNFLLTQTGHKTTYTVSADGGYTVDLFTAENRGFTQYHRVMGRINYQLLRRMNVGLFSSYEWDKFVQSAILREKQIDQIWTIGANASYQLFKWLNLSLEFNHSENHSNIDSADYSDYRGIFRVTATY